MGKQCLASVNMAFISHYSSHFLSAAFLLSFPAIIITVENPIIMNKTWLIIRVNPSLLKHFHLISTLKPACFVRQPEYAVPIGFSHDNRNFMQKYSDFFYLLLYLVLYVLILPPLLHVPARLPNNLYQPKTKTNTRNTIKKGKRLARSWLLFKNISYRVLRIVVAVS